MVCCGVVVNNGKILMIKKGSEPSKGKWSPPGGRQKDNETLEETCIREMKEEVNLEVEIIKKLIFFDKNNLDEKTAEEFGIDGIYFFLCKPILNLNNIKKGSDAADMKWLSKEEALNMDLTISARKLLNEVKI